MFQYLDGESLTLCTKVGLATTHFSTIGVYQYRIADSPAEFNTCSVIVNPGPKVGNLAICVIVNPGPRVG
ncbi:hypothetical protein DPMN_113224 [Dreissena polymorpha]|uniref:Uncharacterized protein n=1 Tax=Dreissena polymorpha TaxID=45954 RepID=A0A9D4KIE5_DREPO|nr:hypothetical protein DPMN_113224 [Dreissena polymorpha]